MIGQQKVPKVVFEIQVTEDLMTAMHQYAEMTGLDGVSLMNYVFTRGLNAIKRDYAKIETSEPPEEGATQE